MTDYPRYMGNVLVSSPEQEAAIWATWEAASVPAPVEPKKAGKSTTPPPGQAKKT